MKQRHWLFLPFLIMWFLLSCDPLIVSLTCSSLEDCYPAGSSDQSTWVCQQGKCVCAENKIECKQEKKSICVDPKTNPQHCGSCSNQCKSGESCCDGGCVDFQTSNQHCGACGKVCRGEQTCQQGSCRCPDKQPDYCPQVRQCFNLQSNAKNCGTCGRSCAEGNSCINGDCVDCATDADCKEATLPVCDTKQRKCINGLASWVGNYPYPTGSDLHALAIQDSKVLMVGKGGIVLRSDFEGLGFQAISLSTEKDLFDVTWSTEGTAVVVGESGAIFRTTDSGATWDTNIKSGTQEPLNGLANSQSGLMLAVGNNGTILRSGNWGETWSVINSGTQKHLYGVVIRDAIAVAVGQSGTILRSDDQGKTWKADTTAGVTQTLRRVDIYNGIIIAVGDAETFLRYDPTGKNWKVFDLSVCSGLTRGLGLRSVALHKDVFLIVGGGETTSSSVKRLILSSTDNGQTWNCSNKIWVEPLSDVTLSKDSLIVAVGERGSVARSTDVGASWHDISFGNSSVLRSVTTEKNIALTSGSRGSILRSEDGGKTWKVVRDRGGNVRSIAIRGKLAIAAGSGELIGKTRKPSILYSNDAGKTWKEADSIPQPAKSEQKNSWYGLTITDKGVAIAVGDYGRIFRSEDGGKTWQKTKSSAAGFDQLRGIASYKDVVIVVGNTVSSILRSTDGGKTNTWKTLKTATSLQGIFLRDSVAIAVGSDGVILRSTDQGATWDETVPSGTKALLRSISMSGDIAIAVGEDSTILRSTDKGKTWSKPTHPATGKLYGVTVNENLQGIVVGNRGIYISSWSN